MKPWVRLATAASIASTSLVGAGQHRRRSRQAIPALRPHTGRIRSRFETRFPLGSTHRIRQPHQRVRPAGPEFDTIDEDNVEPLRSFNDNRFIFEEVEARRRRPRTHLQCAELPRMPSERGDRRGEPDRRAPHRSPGWSGGFFESLGGSLIHSRATHQNIVERVAFEDDVRTFRISTNTLGAGFIEVSPTRRCSRSGMRNRRRCVAPRSWCRFWRRRARRDSAASAGRTSMPASSRSPQMRTSTRWASRRRCSRTRTPRRESSSATAPAMTGSPIRRTMASTWSHLPTSCDRPRRRREGAITREVVAGEGLFNQVGCNSCHVATLRTARPGTRINGDAFTVPAALGNKLFHPYSDFLLHDIGTGDGIPRAAGAGVRRHDAARSARRRSGHCGRAIV